MKLEEMVDEAAKNPNEVGKNYNLVTVLLHNYINYVEDSKSLEIFVG